MWCSRGWLTGQRSEYSSGMRSAATTPAAGMASCIPCPPSCAACSVRRRSCPENECGTPVLFDQLDKIPPDLDWISIDGYWGYEPGRPGGATEAHFGRAFAEKYIYPRMSPSQKLMVVPGTFACSNFSYMPLENSSRSVVAKLQAYFEWAKEDHRVVGMMPWHINRLPPVAPTGPACDMVLGAVDIPGVVAELRTIADWIKTNSTM